MARYRDFRKDDTIASIRMYGMLDTNNYLTFTYVALMGYEETKIPFDSRDEADKFAKKLIKKGYKEW